MSLHRKLEELADNRAVRIFKKPFTMLVGQLESLGCEEWGVRLEIEAEDPPWRKYVSDKEPKITHTLIVEGKHDGRVFSVQFPAQGQFLIPYTVAVVLNTRFEGTAVYRKALVGKKWEWERHPERIEELKAIPLPKINPNHNWGGYRFPLKQLMLLQPVPEEQDKTLWISFSGFEGFVVGVGPRLPKFLRAAPAIESALSEFRL